MTCASSKPWAVSLIETTSGRVKGVVGRKHDKELMGKGCPATPPPCPSRAHLLPHLKDSPFLRRNSVERACLLSNKEEAT